MKTPGSIDGSLLPSAFAEVSGSANDAALAPAEAEAEARPPVRSFVRKGADGARINRILDAIRAMNYGDTLYGVLSEVDPEAAAEEAQLIRSQVDLEVRERAANYAADVTAQLMQANGVVEVAPPVNGTNGNGIILGPNGQMTDPKPNYL